MRKHGVDDQTLRRMLAEARAQYDVRPSDYLEGVVTALHETFDEVPFVDGRRDDELAQHAAAAGRTAHTRVREHYRGRIATLDWILGRTAQPPVQPVLTEPTEDPGLH